MCVHYACCCCRLLHAAFTKGMTLRPAFRRSLSQMANLEWLPFTAALPACLELRGDGFRAALGPVCTFPTSQGR